MTEVHSPNATRLERTSNKWVVHSTRHPKSFYHPYRNPPHDFHPLARPSCSVAAGSGETCTVKTVATEIYPPELTEIKLIYVTFQMGTQKHAFSVAVATENFSSV